MSRYLSVFGQSSADLQTQYSAEYNTAILSIDGANKAADAISKLPLASAKDLVTITRNSLERLRGQVDGVAAEVTPSNMGASIDTLKSLSNKAAILQALLAQMAVGGDISSYLSRAQDLFVIDDTTTVVLYKHALQDWQTELDENGKMYQQFQRDIEFAKYLETSARTAAPDQQQKMMAIASQIQTIANSALVDVKAVSDKLVTQKAKLDDAAQQMKSQGLMGYGLGAFWIPVIALVIGGILIWHLIDQWFGTSNEEKKKLGLNAQQDKIDVLRQQYLSETNPQKKKELKEQLDVEMDLRKQMVGQMAPTDWLGTAAWWALGAAGIWFFFKIRPWEMVTEIMAALPAGGGSSRGSARDDEDEAPVRRRPALAPAARSRKPKLRPKPHSRPHPAPAMAGYRFRRHR
jgi:hypothetical protein